MAHEVQGVVSLAKDAPVELTTIVVPDPGPGEALVDVQTLPLHTGGALTHTRRHSAGAYPAAQ